MTRKFHRKCAGVPRNRNRGIQGGAQQCDHLNRCLTIFKRHGAIAGYVEVIPDHSCEPTAGQPWQPDRPAGCAVVVGHCACSCTSACGCTCARCCYKNRARHQHSGAEDAVVDEKTKEATVKSGDFTVKVKPDRKADKGEDVRPAVPLPVAVSVSTQAENGKVTSVTVKKNLRSNLRFKGRSTADSAYSGGISRQIKMRAMAPPFHEGNHGQDFISMQKPILPRSRSTRRHAAEFDKKMLNSEANRAIPKDMKPTARSIQTT